MTPEQTRYRDAYRVSLAACKQLSTLLRARYGSRAGDMRYRAAETPEIAQAMQAKRDASAAAHEAWLATLAR